MEVKARMPKQVVILIAIVAGLLVADPVYFSCQADTINHKEVSIDLGFLVDSLTFLSDDETLLLISNEEQRVVFFDLKKAGPVREILYKSLGGDSFSSDITISPEMRYAYLIGQADWTGVVVRLDLKSFESKAIYFSDNFSSPSVAVDAAGKLFISDLNSSSIMVLENDSFEKEKGVLRRHYGSRRSIYLQNGPAIKVGVSHSGDFIFASHERLGKISLIDAETLEPMDELETGGKMPLAMDITTSYDRTSKNPQTSMIAVDSETDSMVIADLDTTFRSFAETIKVPLGGYTGKQIMINSTDAGLPVILSADNSHKTIIVGSRTSGKILTFSRIGNSFERRNSFTFLQNPPADIDLAPGGHSFVVLSSDRRSLKIINNQNELLTARSSSIGSESVRKSQRVLSRLGFPVGVVDGVDGPETRRAVALFQKEQQLEPTGTIDKKTADALFGIIQTFVYVEEGSSEHLKAIRKKMDSLLSLHQVSSEVDAHFIIRQKGAEVIIENPAFGVMAPPVSISDPSYVQLVFDHMRNLAGWRTAADLNNPDTEFKIKLDIRNYSEQPGSADQLQVSSGTVMEYRVENNDSRELFVYLLDVSSDGSIKMLYPFQSEDRLSLQPGEFIENTIETFTPWDREAVVDVFKVIATTKYIDPFLLPDGMILSSRMSARSIQGELELFIADSIRGKIRVAGPDVSRAWGTTQKTLIIKRSRVLKPVIKNFILN